MESSSNSHDALSSTNKKEFGKTIVETCVNTLYCTFNARGNRPKTDVQECLNCQGKVCDDCVMSCHTCEVPRCLECCLDHILERDAFQCDECGEDDEDEDEG